MPYIQTYYHLSSIRKSPTRAPSLPSQWTSSSWLEKKSLAKARASPPLQNAAACTMRRRTRENSISNSLATDEGGGGGPIDSSRPRRKFRAIQNAAGLSFSGCKSAPRWCAADRLRRTETVVVVVVVELFSDFSAFRLYNWFARFFSLTREERTSSRDEEWSSHYVFRSGRTV